MWGRVETLIHHQPQEYYRVLGECDRASDCTPFITFMLEQLVDALAEGINAQQVHPGMMPVQMPVEDPKSLSLTPKCILAAISHNPAITLVQLADELNVNSRTIERNIKMLQEKGLLVRVGAAKSGYWRMV